MSRKKIALGIGLVALLVIGIAVYVLFNRPATSFTTHLLGTITLEYGDGTTKVYSTDSTLWDQLITQSILSANGQKLNNIKTDLSLIYSVTGASSSVTAQYWVIYYMQVTGAAGTAMRIVNVPLLGNSELYIGEIGTQVYDTDRWYLMRNNLGFGPYANYYAEKGSGLPLGNINLGADQAMNVYNAVSSTVPVAASLASSLTTLLGSTTKTNGQTEPLISWSRTGPQFYVDMWSIAYPNSLWGISLPSGSFCIPVIAVCGGAGAYLRMHEGDQYTVSFRTAIFYRWQDTTGFWTPWQEQNAELAKLTFGIASGWYTVLGIKVGGSVTLT